LIKVRYNLAKLWART